MYWYCWIYVCIIPGTIRYDCRRGIEGYFTIYCKNKPNPLRESASAAASSKQLFSSSTAAAAAEAWQQLCADDVDYTYSYIVPVLVLVYMMKRRPLAVPLRMEFINTVAMILQLTAGGAAVHTSCQTHDAWVNKATCDDRLVWWCCSKLGSN